MRFENLDNITITNLQSYITRNFDPTSYGRDKKDFHTYYDVAAFIRNTFLSEKSPLSNAHFYKYIEFRDWCQGLPTVLDTCYYYNRSAMNDLKSILSSSDTRKLPCTTNSEYCSIMTNFLFYAIISYVEGIDAQQGD